MSPVSAGEGLFSARSSRSANGSRTLQTWARAPASVLAMVFVTVSYRKWGVCEAERRVVKITGRMAFGISHVHVRDRLVLPGQSLPRSPLTCKLYVLKYLQG